MIKAKLMERHSNPIFRVPDMLTFANFKQKMLDFLNKCRLRVLSF